MAMFKYSIDNGYELKLSPEYNLNYRGDINKQKRLFFNYLGLVKHFGIKEAENGDKTWDIFKNNGYYEKYDKSVNKKYNRLYRKIFIKNNSIKPFIKTKKICVIHTRENDCSTVHLPDGRLIHFGGREEKHINKQKLGHAYSNVLNDLNRSEYDIYFISDGYSKSKHNICYQNIIKREGTTQGILEYNDRLLFDFAVNLGVNPDNIIIGDEGNNFMTTLQLLQHADMLITEFKSGFAAGMPLAMCNDHCKIYYFYNVENVSFQIVNTEEFF